MAGVAEVDMVVAMEEEEIIGTVEKMLEWCDTMTDHNWRFIRHMISITTNVTG